MTPSPAKARGRPKVSSDEQQKKLIVSVSFDLFCDRGYGGMTMDDVASRCQISKKTLYRLFPSKLELVAVIIDAHRQTMLDIRPEWDRLPLVEALEHIFRVDIGETENRARIAFIRVVMVDSVQYPELRALVETRGRAQSHAMITEWLVRQQALGRMRMEDPPATARLLLDVGFSTLAAATGPGWDWPAFADWRLYLRRVFTVIVQGLAPRPDG